MCHVFAVPIAISGAELGRGSGPIHLDSVDCFGREHSLADCYHDGVGNHDCSHYEDAGVICAALGNSTYTGSHFTSTLSFFSLILSVGVPTSRSVQSNW